MKKWRENRVGKGMAVMLSAVLLVVTVLGGMPSETHASENVHKHVDVTYTAWTKTDSLPTEPGNYYLTKNVTLLEVWKVPTGTTNLCLNGRTILQAAEVTDQDKEVNVFEIRSSCRLNLHDCPGGGKLTGAKGCAVDNGGTFYMYGGEICGNVSKHTSGGVYNNSGAVFYMYGGQIYGNTAEALSGGVGNLGTFHMYGGKISGNTGKRGGVELGVVNGIPTTMIVGGNAVISGNKDWNGVEKNVYMSKTFIDSAGKVIIDSEISFFGTAKIGITAGKHPTEKAPIPLTDSNDQDYSSYFYSDNKEYPVTDGTDHVVLLGVEHEHTQDVESWSYDADSHWKKCSECGKKYKEAAHAFGEWVTDREATKEEAGEKHRNCGVCGIQETKIIPAISPTESPVSTPSATPAPTSPATEQLTPTPPATVKPSATEKPVATQKPSETQKPGATATPGEIRMVIEMGGDVPDMSVSISAQELASFVLTEDEKRQVENGTDATMRLTVVDAENRVSDADQAAVGAVSGSYVLGQYLDINLYKDMGGGNITRITAPLGKNIALTMAVPDRLKNTDRKKTREFAVIRVHDGAAAVLPDQDRDANTITIETDRFSTYAIVYKDTEVGSNDGGNKSTVSKNSKDDGSKTDSDDSQDSDKKNPGKKSDSAKEKHAKDNEPKTGDDTPLELVATVAMISGLSYVLLYFLERRHGMTEETKKEITARIISWARKGGRFRKGMAIAAIFVFLVYYHSIGKEIGTEWKQVYGE